LATFAILPLVKVTLSPENVTVEVFFFFSSMVVSLPPMSVSATACVRAGSSEWLCL
jgi:hypothetical protein